MHDKLKQKTMGNYTLRRQSNPYNDETVINLKFKDSKNSFENEGEDIYKNN